MKPALCALVLSLVTACGSTAQQQAVGVDSGPGPQGVTSGQGAPTSEVLGGVESAGGGSTGGSGPVSEEFSPDGAVTSGDGGSTGSRRTTGGGSTTGAGPVGPGRPAGRQGPGITDKTIKVGIVSNEDPNEGARYLGLAGLETHNSDQIYDVLIDDLNKRGGIGGRGITLVVHRYGNESNNDTLQQAACEKFTRDEPVFTVLTALGENAQACFEKHGVSTIAGGYASGYGVKQYAAFPHLINPGAFDIDNQLTTVVNGLRAQGWLGGWNPVTGTAASTPPYVGVIAFDIPRYRDAVNNRALPGLAAAGVKKTEVSFITPNETDGTRDAQATVQKFKTMGVSHLMFLDNSGGAMELIFSINANSQGYFPRYGCDSGSCNYLVAMNMPPATLRGAVLVGWAPLVDVPASRDHVLPGRARCEKLMRDRGMAPYRRNDLNVMTNICSGVWFFEAAAKAAGPRLIDDTLLQGAYAIGTAHGSPGTFEVRVKPGKHAGANAYRYAVWDATCGNSGENGCFIYTGPVRRFDT